MKFINNANKVLSQSWSMQLWYLAGLLQVLALSWQDIKPDFAALVSPAWLHILGIVFGMAGQAARLIYQQELHPNGEEHGPV